MAISWRYDLVDGARLRINGRSIELVRRAYVYGIPIAPLAGDTDWQVLQKVYDSTGCPKIGDELDTTIDAFVGMTFQRAEMQTRQRITQDARAQVDLIYSKAGIGLDPLAAAAWTLEDSGNISQVATSGTTAGVKQIQVWYKPGTAATVATKPAGADLKTVQITRMQPSRVFRATAEMTFDQWEASRISTRLTVGSINVSPWGSTAQGTWFHAPITISTTDKGKSKTVTLTFLENPLGWYGLGVYHRGLDGQIPPDISTESELRSGGNPIVGDLVQRNGLVLASIYREKDFNVLPFSPDDL